MVLHVLEDLEHYFQFSIHFALRNSREKLQTNIWKI